MTEIDGSRLTRTPLSKNSFQMHILKIDSAIPISGQETVLPGEYLIEDMLGAQLLLMADGGTMTPLLEHRRRFREDQDWNGKRVLVMRQGGFGDLILLTPVLREIKKRWPLVHLAVATMSHYAPALANLGFIDEFTSFPVSWNTAEEFDAWIFFESMVEKNPLSKSVHMSELFAMVAGLTDVEDLLPAYVQTPGEAIWAREAYPRVPNVRRVCIQPATSARCRIYKDIGKVGGLMMEAGWEVFLLGQTGGEFEPNLPPQEKLPKHLRNLIPLGLKFRQSCAVLATADVFIGADSSLLHVAGALEVPAVGLYGPFPWKLRTAHSPTTYAIQGSGDCAPCMHHVGGTMKKIFPDKCPSASTGYCGVLATIKPDRVVAKADSIARQYREPDFSFPAL